MRTVSVLLTAPLEVWGTKLTGPLDGAALGAAEGCGEAGCCWSGASGVGFGSGEVGGIESGLLVCDG